MARRSPTTRLRLRTGDEVAVRPVEPADKELLARSFARLSAQSRYRRFFAPLDRLSPAQLRYLTEVDHTAHEALVALDGDGELVAVARYVRDAAAPEEAEVAVTVADDWQGRGLGTALLEALADRARDAGISCITAVVQRDNVGSLRMLEHLGDPVAEPDGTTVQLRIALPERGTGVGLQEALRASAAGSIVVVGSVLQRAAAAGRRSPSRPPPDPDPAIRVVVTGTDGSQSATVAAQAACELAVAVGAHVHVVSAYNRLAAGPLRAVRSALPDAVSPLSWLLAGREDAVAVLDAAFARLAGTGAELSAHPFAGEPAEALIAVAEREQADLVVVGAKGMGAPGRFLVGSVADKVVRHAPCSVLVARPRRAT